MEQIIDIEALYKMPITDEFANILFEGYTSKEVQVIYNPNSARNLSATSIKQGVAFTVEDVDKYYRVHIYPNGTITKTHYWNVITEVDNAFQIVRYIDNYLQQDKIFKIDLSNLPDMLK